MSEFKRVPRPVFPPRHCALCGTHEGPFADTELEIVNYGHVYICCSTERRAGCVRQLAKLDHLVPAENLEQALSDLRNRDHQIAELEARTMEVVSVEDVREALLQGALREE